MRASTLAAIVALNGKADFPAHLCCGLLGVPSLLRFDAQASGLSLAAEVAQAESALINLAELGGGFVYFSVDTASLNHPGLYNYEVNVAMA